MVLALVLFGAALRFASLGAIPPGLHPDEAATAYEARCLWRSGRSSDGRVWPFTVRMHGRYEVEATYAWLAAPCAGLPLPLEVWVRLPAAVGGILLLPLGYLLARRLFGAWCARWALVFLACEPLAWHYARLGLRATLVPPLLVGGLLLLCGPGRGEGRRGLGAGLASGACLALAAASYTPARLVVPCLALALLLPGLRGPAPLGPRALAAALPCLVLGLSLPWTLDGGGGARLDAIALWRQDLGPAALVAGFLRGYALHFAPRTLFWGSSSKGFWAEDVAPLLAVEVLLLPLGLACAVRRARRGHLSSRLLLVWLLVAPLASALTVPAPNPLRAIAGLPLWALLSAHGVRALRAALRPRIRARQANFLAGGAVACCLPFALWSYGVRFPAERRRDWFRPQNTAFAALLGEAKAAGARLRLDVGWLEASLVLARAARPATVTELEDQRRRVHVGGPRGPLWRARSDPQGLTLWRGRGPERRDYAPR